jgi:NAD(P)-dependent dehydrogenase (short-subunit alcohol dehydrogenase family)
LGGGSRPARRALVTGGRSGIGAALVRALAAGGAEVVVVDLADGHDVGDPGTWRALEGPFDVACLNAGVVTGARDVAAVSDEEYRRILRVNVEGVVLGVRELGARLMPAGGDIVVTASLAGLTPMEGDPLYAGTKHFLVGFVRSAAAGLAARGIRINAICPGIVDTPLLGEDGRARLVEAGFPLLAPDDVAAAVAAARASGDTGGAWVVQPGREPEPYRFRGVPGPRVEGAEGSRPPL